MKKILLSMTTLSLVMAFSQEKTGINTTNPQATLEVAKETTNATNDVEGILIPRVSKNKAFLMGGNASIEESTLIYVTDVSDYTTTPVDAKVADITENGYYLWNGTKWVTVSSKNGQEWKDGVNSSGNNLIYANQAKTAGKDIVVTDDGKIGIGTTSPKAFLDVVGSVRLAKTRTSFTDLNSYPTQNSDNTLMFGAPGSHDSFEMFKTTFGQNVLGDDNATLFFNGIDRGHTPSNVSFVFGSTAPSKKFSPILYMNGQNSRVGIGTTDPTETLHVAGKVRVGELPNSTATSDKLVVADADGVLKTKDASSLVFAKAEWKDGVNANGDNLVYAIQAKASGNDVMITDEGKVGIGTDTPKTALDVKGIGVFQSQDPIGMTGNPPALDPTNYYKTHAVVIRPHKQIVNGASLNDEQGFVGFLDGNNKLNFSVGYDTDYLGTSKEDRELLFDFISPSTGKIQRIASFKSTGKVGFGSEHPQARMHINLYAGDQYPVLMLSGGNDNTGDLVVEKGQTLKMGAWDEATTSFEEHMRIANNGNVGIGTAIPRHKLEVNNGLIAVSKTSAGVGSSGRFYISESDEPDNFDQEIILTSNPGNQTGAERTSIFIGPSPVAGLASYGRLQLSGGDVWVSNGNMRIGGESPATEKLEVAGNVKANAFMVGTQTLSVPDYVFEDYYTGSSELNSSYKFKSLNEVESFVKTKGHLPGYKSAKQIKEEGVMNMTENQLTNMEKIEELYLHTIEQEKKIEKQSKEIDELKKLVKQLLNK